MLTAADHEFNAGGVLGPSEYFWRTHFAWLKNQGYQLRPRYSPDWVPSWTVNQTLYLSNEDGRRLRYGQINDAVHIPTGSRVALKIVLKKEHPYEETISRYLTSETLSADPRNHCVPILDVLHPPNEQDDTLILVMPLLRQFGSPIFDTLGEAMECIRQLFEGLQFIHECHVAHRDINMNNFMMESRDMFPQGYHTQDILLKSDLSGPARYYTRTQRPPRYYIIDFGISRQYDVSDTSPREPVILGGDSTVPEFKNPYEAQNPYWTDVYYAGNLVRTHFLQGHPILTHIRGYKGLEFLKPLIDDMVQDDPSKRPTMDEVVRRFEAIGNDLSPWRFRSRIPWRRANVFQACSQFVSHWKRRVVYVVTRTPALPRPKKQSSSSLSQATKQDSQQHSNGNN